MPEEMLNVPEAQETENETDNFAEKFAALEERFAEVQAQLEQEQTDRKAIEEKFAESEKARRLMHFADVIGTLAVSDEPEQFAEDLYAMEQVDGELTERMIARMRALTEAVSQGELFAQKSKAKAPEVGDPWLKKVEAVRQEHFATMPVAEGWVEAEKLAANTDPEAARDYAERTRRGE